ncbi:MAG: calcium/sodium antiporter [Alphaproteobacteria bacterium]|nr:calcium/sodium antiporter [Alphaproteobacteria bacterium]
MMFVLVVVGLVILLVGAEFLVRGAVGLASRLGVSKLVIGLTVVAFGTSAPELVVSVTASLRGASEIALGNVVGSNVCNIMMVLGAAAIVRPIVCTTPWLVRDGISVLAATVLMIVIGALGEYTAVHGVLFLTLLALFLYYCYHTERRAPARATHASEVDEVSGVPSTTAYAAGLLFGGLIAVVVGSELLVMGAIDIARFFGVSESAIGLTLIAFGTSLPELATVLVAVARGHDDIAAGNVLGSNLFNILGVLGAAAITAPVPVVPAMLTFDFWIMLGAVLVLLPYMISGRKLGRVTGTVFVIVYVGFVAAQFLGFSGMPNHV